MIRADGLRTSLILGLRLGLKLRFGSFLLVLFSLLSVNHVLANEDDQMADEVLVLKSERMMYLLANGKVIREYSIGLGGEPKGHKQQEGDERTPEGRYIIDYRNLESAYYLSLHISYPNDADKAKATAKGVEPGGMIMIHGLPNKFGWATRIFKGRDWTDGCIAVSNIEMDEIAELVANGTPIEIRP